MKKLVLAAATMLAVSSLAFADDQVMQSLPQDGAKQVADASGTVTAADASNPAASSTPQDNAKLDNTAPRKHHHHVKKHKKHHHKKTKTTTTTTTTTDAPAAPATDAPATPAGQ